MSCFRFIPNKYPSSSFLLKLLLKKQSVVDSSLVSSVLPLPHIQDEPAPLDGFLWWQDKKSAVKTIASIRWFSFSGFLGSMVGVVSSSGCKNSLLDSSVRATIVDCVVCAVQSFVLGEAKIMGQQKICAFHH